MTINVGTRQSVSSWLFTHVISDLVSNTVADEYPRRSAMINFVTVIGVKARVYPEWDDLRVIIIRTRGGSLGSHFSIDSRSRSTDTSPPLRADGG